MKPETATLMILITLLVFAGEVFTLLPMISALQRLIGMGAGQNLIDESMQTIIGHVLLVTAFWIIAIIVAYSWLEPTKVEERQKNRE